MTAETLAYILLAMDDLRSFYYDVKSNTSVSFTANEITYSVDGKETKIKLKGDKEQ